MGDVRPGEGRLLALLTCNVFLLLTAYYLLKTVREPLILLSGTFGLAGDELKIYGAGVQAVLLLGIVPLYARIAGRLDRLALVRGTLLMFIASLGLFALLSWRGVPIGLAFYLWLGIVSLLGVAQFWSVATDLHSREAGERLFAIIAVGGSLGSILGSQLARWLIKPMGVNGLLLLAAGVYALSLVVMSLVERHRTSSTQQVPDAAAQTPAAGSFRLVLRDRYLLLIAGMLVLTNLVNTQGEFILADAIRSQAHAQFPSAVPLGDLAPEARAAIESGRRAFIGRFYGNFYSAVNAISFLLQALVVSRLMKHFGTRALLFLVPGIAVLGYGGIALLPSLAVVTMTKLAENSLDYSAQNTARQALFLPTSRAVKYKAKAAIDTWFVRLGDALAAGVVAVGIHLLGLSRRGFAVANLLVAVVLMGVVIGIAQRHRLLARDERRFELPRLGGRRLAAPGHARA